MQYETASAEREQQVDQARHEKERAAREAGVAEKNRVDVHMQRDRELKSGKITRVGRGSQGTGKGRDQVTYPSRDKEGAIKDEVAARGASRRELSEVRASSSRRLFSRGLISPSFKLY